MMNNCSHLFCVTCFKDWDTKKDCPMVRKTFGEITALCKPVHYSIENWKILSDEHRPCLFNFIPVLKEYVADLNEVWMNFIGFVFKTQVYEENYVGIRGIEYLNLRRYENEGRLLKKGPSYAIIKKKNGIAKVVVGCYLPCMSLRLVISPNDNTDIGQDDEYADEAVGYMNKQLEVCWSAFPKLLSTKNVNHMYVRKFKNVTCYLLLRGFYGSDIRNHCAPMEEQLRNLKRCNFNESLLNEIREVFPLCDLNFISNSKDNNLYDWCKNFNQNNDSVNGNENKEGR